MRLLRFKIIININIANYAFIYMFNWLKNSINMKKLPLSLFTTAMNGIKTFPIGGGAG